MSFNPVPVETQYNYCQSCGRAIVKSRYSKTWWTMGDNTVQTVSARERCLERESRTRTGLHSPLAATASLSVKMAKARLLLTIMKLERMES